VNANWLLGFFDCSEHPESALRLPSSFFLIEGGLVFFEDGGLRTQAKTPQMLQIIAVVPVDVSKIVMTLMIVHAKSQLIRIASMFHNKNEKYYSGCEERNQ
jgi:hypothetical protein